MRVKLTADEAISCLPDGEYIHTYLNGAGLLLGADWSREDVVECLRANSCEMAGPEARKMGHGICIDRYEGKRRVLFIETVESKLVKFDEGEDPVEWAKGDGEVANEPWTDEDHERTADDYAADSDEALSMARALGFEVAND